MFWFLKRASGSADKGIKLTFAELLKGQLLLALQYVDFRLNCPEFCLKSADVFLKASVELELVVTYLFV